MLVRKTHIYKKTTMKPKGKIILTFRVEISLEEKEKEMVDQ